MMKQKKFWQYDKCGWKNDWASANFDNEWNLGQIPRFNRGGLLHFKRCYHLVTHEIAIIHEDDDNNNDNYNDSKPLEMKRIITMGRQSPILKNKIYNMKLQIRLLQLLLLLLL